MDVYAMNVVHTILASSNRDMTLSTIRLHVAQSNMICLLNLFSTLVFIGTCNANVQIDPMICCAIEYLKTFPYDEKKLTIAYNLADKQR